MILSQIELNYDNLEDLNKKFCVLSNRMHLKILLLLEEKPRTNEEIYSILNSEGLVKYSGSSYKAVEKLVKNQLVNKKYDSETKRIIYTL